MLASGLLAAVVSTIVFLLPPLRLSAKLLTFVSVGDQIRVPELRDEAMAKQ